mgnify:CR=1 FL=1
MTQKQAYIFLAITGAILILNFVLAFMWFGWKLALIIFLTIVIMAANNTYRWK